MLSSSRKGLFFNRLYVEGIKALRTGRYYLIKCFVVLAHRRIPLKDVPCDTVEETSNWCKKVYQEKVTNVIGSL